MKNKRRLRVEIPQRYNDNAFIGFENWKYKGKKRRIIVVRDQKGRKLARSVKIKTLKEAKRKFLATGHISQEKNLRVRYTSFTKERIKTFDNKMKFTSRKKEFQAYAYTIVIIKGKPKRIDATTRYFDSGTNKEEALKQVERKLASRVDGITTGIGSDSPYVKRGSEYIKRNGLIVNYGIITRTKR